MQTPLPFLRRRIGDIDLAVEPVQQQRGRHTEDQTQGVGNAALHAAYEARKRDNGQCRGKDDADDDMRNRGMVLLQQIIHPLRQKDDRQQRADAAGDQDAEIEVADALHERRIQAERHQKRGEAHTGRDHAHRQTEAAEQVPAEIRRDFNRQIVQYEQQSKKCGESDGHADIILAGHRPLGPCFAEERGQHTDDQADKQANRCVGIRLEQNPQHLGNAEEADSHPDDDGQQRQRIPLERAERIGQQRHNRRVNAEHHAQHAAGNTGEHGAESDQYAL